MSYKSTRRVSSRRLPALVACAVFGLASLGFAANASAKPGVHDHRAQIAQADDKPSWTERKARMLARYDRDRDGQLSERERRAMKADRADRKFDRMDRDSDGVITRSEYQAAMAERHDRFERRMERRRDRGDRGERRRGYRHDR